MRGDLARIAARIPAGARVLDLACGDGALLLHLRQSRNANGIGVDMNNRQLAQCLANGLQAIHTDIRGGLALFPSDSFDFVVLSQTLQNIDRSLQTVVKEMLRVGKRAIVSFPNFAHWRFRLQLLRGRMPVGGRLPYAWDNTPYVRFCTVADFDSWLQANNMQTLWRLCLTANDGEARLFPNVLAETAIYEIAAANNDKQ